MSDLIAHVAKHLTPSLPPAPSGMHWEPKVRLVDQDPDYRFSVTWSLVLTETYDEEQA